MKKTSESYYQNYTEKLDNYREVLTKDRTKSSESCISFLQGLISEAQEELRGKTNPQGEDLSEVLIRTLSKDLSRYYDSYSVYNKTLAEMNTTNLSALRHKLVNSTDFFKNTWKEDSDNFFRTRKLVNTYLTMDQELAKKINQTLDCIVVSLFRILLDRYGK